MTYVALLHSIVLGAGKRLIMADLREIGPSFYFAPPRTLELLLTRVMIRMEDAGFIKRKLLDYFVAVARCYGERILNGRPGPRIGRPRPSTRPVCRASWSRPATTRTT